MTDLFLSYKAEDRTRVAPLVEALEADGYSVWWDADIAGGEEWRETICRYLDAARCVIVVWSKKSVGPGGHFVRDEATRALRRGVYLPVKIDKVEPPLGFGETQVLNLQGWKGDPTDAKYEAVRAAVRSRLNDERAPSDTPTPGGLKRRTVIVGASALTVAAAAAGLWSVLGSRSVKGDGIAVLPFANLSGDSSQDYFSDGIAEELRSVLSRIPGLKVVARTSSEAVRNADAKTAASKLHVSNVLTGSVRRSSSLLRIGAQLVDGGDGTERWSDVYDRPPGDSLRIQSEIANMVAQALSVRLMADERRPLIEGGTRNADAQDLLLQAKGLLWRNDDQPVLRRAMDLSNQALALDPQYADAHAAKATVLGVLGGQMATSTADMESKLAAAEASAREAIRLAPRSVEAHATLGRLWSLRLRIRQALAEFEIMERLPGGASNSFQGGDPYAIALGQSRKFEQALSRSDRIIASDPLNPSSYLTKAGILGHARRYHEAVEAAQQSIDLAPELIWPRAFHAMFMMQMGHPERAEAEFAALGTSGPWAAWAAVAAERLGKRDEANRIIDVMRRSMGDSGYYQYAQVYAQQERIEDAIRTLEKAWEQRDAGLAFVQVDPMLDPLRNDQRFKAVVKRLDFPS